MSTLTQAFQDAIASAKTPPKGVKVTLDTWRELKDANLIKKQPAEGMWPFDEWHYGKVIVLLDPELELEDLPFKLPPNS